MGKKTGKTGFEKDPYESSDDVEAGNNEGAMVPYAGGNDAGDNNNAAAVAVYDGGAGHHDGGGHNDGGNYGGGGGYDGGSGGYGWLRRVLLCQNMPSYPKSVVSDLVFWPSENG